MKLYVRHYSKILFHITTGLNGKKLDAAKNEYSAAMNKLVDGRGNLVNSVEKIKKLGAKAKKSIPEQILLRSKDED